MQCRCCQKEINEETSINGVCLECNNEIIKRINEKNKEDLVIKKIEKNRRIEELAQYEINNIKKTIINSIPNQSYKNKTNKINFVQVFGLLIILIIIYYLLLKKNDSTFSNTNNTYIGTLYTSEEKRNIYSSDFTLLKDKTTSSNEDGIYTITGKIKQNIEGNYTNLIISFTLYDKNHNEVRKTSGFILSNYEGNGIWSFEVHGNDTDNIVTSYELDYCYGV